MTSTALLDAAIEAARDGTTRHCDRPKSLFVFRNSPYGQSPARAYLQISWSENFKARPVLSVSGTLRSLPMSSSSIALCASMPASALQGRKRSGTKAHLSGSRLELLTTGSRTPLATTSTVLESRVTVSCPRGYESSTNRAAQERLADVSGTSIISSTTVSRRLTAYSRLNGTWIG